MPKKISPDFEGKQVRRAEGADAEVKRSTRTACVARVAKIARNARTTRQAKKVL